MGEPAYVSTDNGQEVQQADVDQIGVTAGLADDHLLADLVRLAPYAGTTFSKAIVPFGYRGGSDVATVSPSGRADGSILVFPFRAIVGSRNTVSGAPVAPPTGLTTDSPALANWRDIRSGVFVGTSNVTLYKSFTLANNASGHPRWDLVYASILPDSSGPTVNRRVKNPTTGQITVVAVPSYLYQPVTVTVVAGTPASVPTLPTLPGDGSGAYNIPIVYVRVPNGFTSSTTVDTQDIRSTTGNGVMDYVSVNGMKMRPCNGNNDGNGAFVTSTGPFYYTPVTAGSRPGPWLPPDWSGVRSFIAEIDNGDASSANWSHQSGGPIDTSIDWRNRFIRVTATQIASSNKFANDPTVTTPSSTTPLGVNTNRPIHSFGNSMVADNTLVSGGSSIWSDTFTNVVGIYVDQATGGLHWYAAGDSLSKYVFWIECTEQFPNL